jgi:hypothetical protein
MAADTSRGGNAGHRVNGGGLDFLNALNLDLHETHLPTGLTSTRESLPGPSPRPRRQECVSALPEIDYAAS